MNRAGARPWYCCPDEPLKRSARMNRSCAIALAATLVLGFTHTGAQADPEASPYTKNVAFVIYEGVEILWHAHRPGKPPSMRSRRFRRACERQSRGWPTPSWTRHIALAGGRCARWCITSRTAT